MISRVAESCFWIMRYIERIESQARILYVNQAVAMDIPLSTEERWMPLVIVSGEEDIFAKKKLKRGEDLAEAVQHFLTWEEGNSSSIYSNLFWARENARTIRETISLETWVAINEAWLWIKSRAAQNLYQRDRYRFFSRLREICTLVHGYTQGTMLHQESFDFMQLGAMLERSSQTARTLDVKYHAMGRTRGTESPLEAAQWLAILHSCSGVEPFFKRSGTVLSGPAVAGFLMFDRHFPRSIHFCLERAQFYLDRVGPDAQSLYGRASKKRLDALVDELSRLTIEKVMARHIHEVLTWVVDETAEVCGVIHADYFDPMRVTRSA